MVGDSLKDDVCHYGESHKCSVAKILSEELHCLTECLKLGATRFKLCQGVQPKLSKFFESYATNLNGASTESSSSATSCGTSYKEME